MTSIFVIAGVYFAIYLIFPRIGTNYLEESKKCDPKAGLNRHYHYDSKIARTHWRLIWFTYAFVTLMPITTYFGICTPPADGHIFRWYLFALGIFSIPGIPYMTVLLWLKYNRKTGMYIYEDRIEYIEIFYHKVIYKKDVIRIKYAGIIWGFVIRSKGNKKPIYIMPLTEDLPQQIATLCNYKYL